MGRRAMELLALALLGLAFATPLQPVGCNQTAHLALVKSLANGSPSIDRYRTESCDTAYVDGHYYAAKAPGLAMVSVPLYALLKLVGLDTENPAAGRPYPEAMLELPRSAVWQVSLLGSALAAFVLLLLVRSVANRLVPGYGTAAAITMGAGTLVLPFATVYFVHVLSGLLGFAAFALLLRERDGPADLRLVAAGGVAAGLAVTVEHPLVIVAGVLGVYAVARGGRARRAAAYSGGILIGLVPLLAFNWWALGSPFRLPYADAVIEPGTSGHDVVGANDEGLFGVGVPNPRDALELLFSARGLLVLSPVVAAGIVGTWLLRKQGRPAESAVIAGVTLGFLVYNAAYYLPFGGFVPGPRFLIPILPFLALGIAASYRAAPLTTGLLAAASIGAMTLATAAEPLLGTDDTASWVRRARAGDFTHTVVSALGGGHGWLAIAPFLLLVLAACGFAAATLRSQPRRGGGAVGGRGGYCVVDHVGRGARPASDRSGSRPDDGRGGRGAARYRRRADRGGGGAWPHSLCFGLRPIGVAAPARLRRPQQMVPRRRPRRLRSPGLHFPGATDGMKVGLSLLTLVPGEVGGSETYARGLCRGLAEVGTLEYTVFTPTIAPGAGGGLPETPVPEYRVARSMPQRALAMALAAARPRRIRRQLDDVDMLHYALTVAVPKVETRASSRSSISSTSTCPTSSPERNAPTAASPTRARHVMPTRWWSTASSSVEA